MSARHGSGGLDGSLDLAAIPSAISTARAFVSIALREWSVPAAVIDDAVLLVSELATNALSPGQVPEPGAAGRISLRVRTAPAGRLRIEVTDGNRRIPVRRQAAPDDESGRGLSIVEALSTGWGHYRHRGTKTVWAELDYPPALIQPDPRTIHDHWKAHPRTQEPWRAEAWPEKESAA